MTASTGAKKRSIVNFEKARLILVDKTSSYVELNTPDDFSTKCLLCNKTNDHDHDIIGKLKFEPKHKSYLVSLVEKKKMHGAGSTTSKNGALDIIPLKKALPEIAPETQNDINIQNIDAEESAKTSQHVYPVSVPDEAAGNYFFS